MSLFSNSSTTFSPDRELREGRGGGGGGGEVNLLALLVFLPSVISSFSPKIKLGLNGSLSARFRLTTNYHALSLTIIN